MLEPRAGHIVTSGNLTLPTGNVSTEDTTGDSAQDLKAFVMIDPAVRNPVVTISSQTNFPKGLLDVDM